MRYRKCARSVVLCAALTGLLITTPAPIVQATEVYGATQNEQQDHLTIEDVKKENKQLLEQLNTFQEKVNTLLPNAGSGKDVTYASIYSDYSSYKENENVKSTQSLLNDIRDLISGNEGYTDQLDKLANEYHDKEPDKNLYDTLAELSKEIITRQNDLRKQETVFNAVTPYKDLVLSSSVTALTSNLGLLRSTTDSKRLALTPENEALYTSASYATYKTIITEADTQIQSTTTLLSTIQTVLTGYITKAADHSLTDDDIADIQKYMSSTDADSAKISAILEKVNALDISKLTKRPSKSSLKKQLNAAKKCPPDKYTTYTKETDSVFKQCLADAQKVYNNPDATSTEISRAATALKNAIKNLKEVDRAYKVVGNTYYYKVSAFGAFGNDKADDTYALQKALDQSRSGVNVVIQIPKGTYYISKTLYIQSNTTLNMASGAKIYRSKSALGKNMLKNTDSKHKTSGHGKYTLSQNITINGGIWDGGDISESKTGCNLIYIGHADNVKLIGTTIRNCHGSHALEFAGVQNGLVRSCKFYGFRYDNDLYTSEAIQFDTCYSDWAPGFTKDKTTCRNITVEKCTISDYPRAVGSHHVLSSAKYENITIRNNKIKRTSASTQGKSIVGIFLMGVKNAKITSNTITGYYYGAMIKQSSKVSMKKNTFRNNGIYNIAYSGNDKANKYVKFTVTKDKVKTKRLTFTAPTIKRGTMKTRGQTYKIRKAKKSYSVKLKKNLKKKQKVSFYGKDKDGNKFYRTYYVN